MNVKISLYGCMYHETPLNISIPAEKTILDLRIMLSKLGVITSEALCYYPHEDNDENPVFFSDDVVLSSIEEYMFDNLYVVPPRDASP